MFFVPAAIVADAPSFASVRADTVGELRAILTSGQRAKFAAIESALRDDLRAALGRARERTGGIGAILTEDQRAAIVAAVTQGQDPDVKLSDAQQAKLRDFASALRDGIVPAWRKRAHEADALLSVDQRAKVIAIRDSVAATTSAAIANALPGPFARLPDALRAPFAPTFDDIASLAAGPDGAGAFALLVDLTAGEQAPGR